MKCAAAVVTIIALYVFPQMTRAALSEQAVCSALLSRSSPATAAVSNEATRDAIAYLSALTAKKVLNLARLKAFLHDLEHEQTTNPISASEAMENSSLAIHREALEAHFMNPTLQLQELRHWVRSTLHSMSIDNHRRSEVTHWASAIAPKTYPVLPGRFQEGYHIFELTHTIEVMSAPVIQAQWVEVMGDNPAYIWWGKFSEQISKGDKVVKLLPEHPITCFTWWSALVYANRLSERMGLTPVYDLSGVKLKGSAEEGNLRLDTNFKSSDVRINAPDGNIYRAKGFRLPTLAEMIHIFSKAKRADGTLISPSDPSFDDHAWLRTDSIIQGDMKPVRTKTALFVDGHPFYDLLGNVTIFLQDGDLTSYLQGTNPHIPAQLEAGRVQFGMLTPEKLISRKIGFAWRSQSIYPDYGKSTLGIRLVRTIDP